jgi:hypothetical protein
MWGSVVWFVTALLVGLVLVGLLGPIDTRSPLFWLPIAPAARVTFGIGLLFSINGQTVPIGIAPHWWNLPGTSLGAVLAVKLAREILHPRGNPAVPEQSEKRTD